MHRNNRLAGAAFWSSLLLVFAVLLSSSLPAEEAIGQLGPPFDAGEVRDTDDDNGDDKTPALELIFKNWGNLAKGTRVATILTSLLLAALLAASIAFHPWSYGKARNLGEIESPKTYIMYAVVGAVCGRLVALEPAVALVIFGLGGLMRFRTDVGAAKDTGRVILVTCVGLCCGFDTPDVAILSTAFAFVLIVVLERSTAYKLMIKGLQPEQLVSAADSHRAILEEMNCHIISEKKSFVKSQVAFVFRTASDYEQDDIEEQIKERVPEVQQGAIDWQSS